MLNIIICEHQDDIITKKGELHKIKNTYGVYKLYNQNDEVIYVGKSKTLRSRVHSHVYEYGHTNFSKEIYKIACVYTYNSYVMDLYELYLINKLKPKHNKKDTYSGEKKEHFLEMFKKEFEVIPEYKQKYGVLRPVIEREIANEVKDEIERNLKKRSKKR